MQAQVAAVRSKIAGLKPITVFDYDSGEAAPFTGPGLAMPNALISLGGGTNVFASLKQSWTSVSWEQVIKADPQCIIINDYGTPTAAQKEKFLETSPITKNLTAVKNRCFLPLSYDEVTPSPRNAEAVVKIAHWLHPSAFGLPATVREEETMDATVPTCGTWSPPPPGRAPSPHDRGPLSAGTCREPGSGRDDRAAAHLRGGIPAAPAS